MSGPIVQNLSARFRQQVISLRNRFSSADKPKTANVVRTSLHAHRPVWVTAGTATYTSGAAVLLALRCMRHLR